MATFFLCMIYAAFISLGLPDSLLGAAWPAMQPALGVPLDSAGVLSMIVAGGTVVASLSADRMLHRFGTGRVTLVSVTMTACALLGYALAPGFWWLALAAVPMGLGAGAVDAGLNNFVALHYEARHMSWLHCFWGVGATLGPVILSLFLGGSMAGAAVTARCVPSSSVWWRGWPSRCPCGTDMRTGRLCGPRPRPRSRRAKNKAR
ncbi:MAG: MFS transporter [Ruthenibacterium lactatiformans]